MPTIALSTGWQPHGSLADTFKLLNASGLDRIEMHRMASNAQIQELVSFCTGSGTTIGSLHALLEPYKATRDNCSGDHLASYSSKRVSDTVDLLKRSLAFCEKNGIPYLVVHVGLLESPEIHESENVSMEGVVKLPSTVMERRVELGKPIVDRLLSIITDCCAEFPGVKLAIENRSRVSQFPLPSELATLLQGTSAGTVGYWHDMAHARGYERLTGFDRSEWLVIAGERAWGTHVQDSTIRYQEHMPIGFGDDTFTLENIGGTIENWVLEVSHEYSPTSVRHSIEVLKSIALTVERSS